MMGRKAKSKRLFFKNEARKRKLSKHKRENLRSWHAERMDLAVEEYFLHQSNPHRLSLRALARAYEIPYTTLNNRVHSSNPRNPKPKLGRKSIFTDEEERELADILKELAKCGFGLTALEVRRLAFQYATSKNRKGFSTKTDYAGYDWYQGFMSRNPTLTVRKPENLSVGRAMNVNETVVKKHFDGIFEVMMANDIIGHPERIWNADETGLQDVFDSTEIIASTKGRVFNLTGRERGETTTLLSAINSNGETAPHLIIFKGVRFRKDLQDLAPLGDMIRMSDSGWIKEDLLTEWGENFVKYLRTKDSLKEKQLLILDGHTTHSLNLAFINLMKNNNIILWCIPPHTSHYLQPLDKNVFASLKKQWNRLGKEKTHRAGGRLLSKDERLALIYEAIPLSFTPENIINGFCRTGISPYNPSRIDPDSFLPSQHTERPLVQSSGDCPIAQPLDEDIPSNVTAAQPEPDPQVPQQIPPTPNSSSVTFANLIKTPENPRKEKTRKPQEKSPSQILTSSAHIEWVSKKKSKTTNPKQKKEKGKRVPQKTQKSKDREPTTNVKRKKVQKSKFCKSLKLTAANTKQDRKNSKNYCSICNEYYFDQIGDEEWICCTNCGLWQHVRCADMMGKNLFGYMCVDCSDE